MNKQNIRYIAPAVTPLLPDGSVDFESCESLFEHLIEGGVDGILILGSIGEFFGLTMQQKKELIHFACGVIKKRVQLIVGTSSMIFAEIVELSNFALRQGADAVMGVPPYYFHFTDESVFGYYDQLAGAIKGEVFLYNFPDRTGYGISPDTVAALVAKHPNIIGIKDTISGMDHTREIIKKVRPVRPDFMVYSGFDDNFVHNVLSGGNGCIAGIANIYPDLTARWTRMVREGDMDGACRMQQTIDKLMDIYAVGKPFIPFIKQALVCRGIISHITSTKPMPGVSPEQKKQIADILKKCCIDQL